MMKHLFFKSIFTCFAAFLLTQTAAIAVPWTAGYNDDENSSHFVKSTTLDQTIFTGSFGLFGINTFEPQADFWPTAGATETFTPAVGDHFFDTGGPGGSNTDGAAGNYPNCNCDTQTTLAGVSEIEFLVFDVFANFDYLRIYDGTDASGTLLYDNGPGGPNDGDLSLAAMIASHGSATFTASSGNFFFFFHSSSVVNREGWDVMINETGGGGPFPSPYCEVSGLGSVEPITNVKVADIDNPSPNLSSAPSHEDFTSVVGNMTQGETYPMEVQGNTAGNFTSSVRAYIDWNQDGDFTDADEYYYIGTIVNSTGDDGVKAEADIAVPADALEGNTRMRIIKRFQDIDPNPNDGCTGGSSFGQAEDYTINVTAGGGGGTTACLPTLMAGGNGGDPGGAVYFDVVVGADNISFTGLDIKTDNAGNTFTVDVYTLEGTYSGNEGNAGAWTLRTSGTGTSLGITSATHVDVDTPFAMNANTTYGVALVLSASNAHYYTNGNGSNQTYTDGTITLNLGSASNVPFTAPINSPRVFNGAVCYSIDGGEPGEGGCESTPFDSNNGGASGWSLMFDMSVNSDDIELTSLEVNVSDAAGTGFDVDVYIADTTYVGNELNPAAWTLVSSGSGVSAGTDNPSPVTLDTPIPLTANQSYGIALVSTASPRYTNGTSANRHFDFDAFDLDLGASVSGLFTGSLFPDRIFNGTICYNGGGGGTGDCEHSLFTDTAADPGNVFNGFAGITFDIQNTSAEPITITGLKVPFTGGASLDLDVYYTTTASTNVGVETNPAEWTLLDSQTGIPASQATDDWDPANFTQINLNNPLELAAGQSKGIYLYVPNYNTGINLRYTNGSFTAADGTMTILSNGFGGEDSPFANTFPDRAFVGEVQYSTCPVVAGCDWTVHVWDDYWGDEVLWELRDQTSGTVLLTGGPYGSTYDETKTITAEGPLEFYISNQEGSIGDNTPNYSVSNENGEIVSGTLMTVTTMTFSDLNCSSVPPPPADYTCADQTVPSGGLTNGYFFDGEQLAVDIIVGDTGFDVYGAKINAFMNPGDTEATFSFNFYDNAAGIPGTLTSSTNGTVVGTEYVGTAYDLDVYTFTIAFDTPVNFAANTTSWMEVVSDAVAWESTVATVFGSFMAANVGSGWGPIGEEGVYTLICEELGVSHVGTTNFAYYPNPVKDVLHITTEKAVESVSVFNMAGQKVISNLSLNKGQVNLSALSPGVYIIRAVLDGNKVETFKVIKK